MSRSLQLFAAACLTALLSTTAAVASTSGPTVIGWDSVRAAAAGPQVIGWDSAPADMQVIGWD
ncbi:hypothetical protein OHA37_21885 [Streptomyces sp. NBC_00335]|uniref:hypothetical protein n=1 Tax=unclassified Streptomyces TaxID=2593676 RepID=UPI002255B2D3|nr:MULTISPECIES: hypothetical protein [unclassified Streptomyces]MCX5406513.1 hypothetical protein [Streptomyces sp. NBC_00086]